MNVLFVNRMMGIAWGGGENYDYHLARGLEQLGHRVRFLTGTQGGEPPRNRRDIAMDTVSTPYLRSYMYRLAGKVRTIPGLIAEFDLRLFERAAVARIPELVRRHAIDVVQVLSLPRLASSLRALPVRVAMRFPGPPAWFHTPLLRRLSGEVGMFAHGDAVGQLHRLGVEAREVPPGVDTAVFGVGGEARSELRARLAAGPDPFVMVSVGRLVHGKGFPFALRAVAALRSQRPQAHLVVVGDGPDRAALVRLASELGIDNAVTFVGHQGPVQVAEWLAAADVFCLLSDYENYSNATLEAMAAGLPVVATRVGGFPMQVADGVNGYLIDPGDLDSLTTRLGALAAYPALRARLSAGAREFSQRFRWSNSAERVSEIYERLPRR